MRSFIVLLILWTLGIHGGYAQQDWQYLYEEQEDRAEELFLFYFEREAYKKALPHLEWLLDHRNDAVYHENAIVIYEDLARRTEEQEDALRYAALCLRQYEELMVLSGDTIGMRNQRLNQAYQLFYDQPAQYLRLKQMSELLLMESGTGFAFYNFSPYIRMLLLMEETRQVEGAAIDEVVKRLEEISRAPANRNDLNYQEAILKVSQILANNP